MDGGDGTAMVGVAEAVMARAMDGAEGSRPARAASGAARHAGQATHKAGRRFGPRSRA